MLPSGNPQTIISCSAPTRGRLFKYVDLTSKKAPCNEKIPTIIRMTPYDGLHFGKHNIQHTRLESWSLPVCPTMYREVPLVIHRFSKCRHISHHQLAPQLDSST